MEAVALQNAGLANTWLATLLRGQSSVPASPRGWLNALRSEALERANALSVPTPRDEEWRFTDLSPLYKTSVRRAEAAVALPAADVARFEVPEAGLRLTFVDGHFAAALSSPQVRDGVVVRPLAAALAEHDPVVQEHLARYVALGDDPFTAVNTAWLQDGVLVRVAQGQAAPAAVHLLFVSTRADLASHPRVLVVAERDSDCTVIEDFVALHEGAYLVNAVTEIGRADAARVRHGRLQRDSQAAFHVATCGVRVGRDAHYAGASIALGARISRYNLNLVQAGEGAQCRIDGLALIGERQLADTHSLLDHTAPNGRSRQLHKCIVGGAGHAVFNGKIFVRPGAQLTDAAQQSRNLLLSERAHVDTKPQLEIFADDVKCAHGATVGQLEPDQVFYLKSRGLSEATARDLLTFAFAAEIVERIPVPSLVRRLEQWVVRQTQNRKPS
jgi:Fe-S cluster assembly protein SufD